MTVRGVLAVVLAGLVPGAAAQSVNDDWSFDVIRLKNGACHRGLIVQEVGGLIHFQDVRRRPGRPTVVLHTTFKTAEIDRLEKLPAAERERLKERLQELEQSGPQAEKERMGRLELVAVAWEGRPRAAWRYQSDHFVLTSPAPEEVVRRAAVRLEQIYIAYARYLEPRHPGGAPTAVILLPTWLEYQKYLAGQKLQFVNPAFFDPAANRIVCASDLQRMGEDLAAVRERHQQLRRRLDDDEAEYRRLYKKDKEKLNPLLKLIADQRTSLDRTDRTNDAVFDRATRQLFATLYHEAFHAYLAGFVYPPAKGELPRWLNEGLAQIYETALVEAGELRVGHADRERLLRAKEALTRPGGLVPLADLLASGPKQFALAHAADRAVADRYYLTSWAVAFHLTFDRRLLAGDALDRYVAALRAGTDAKSAFEELVGKPLGEFEPEFRRYLHRLQPDGSAPAVVGK
jgi:Protein of unknown function (DUF1570)